MYAVSMVKPHLPENWAPSIDGKFEPNLINSVVFLVTAVQQVTVFVVNYKGLPFMSGLLDNSFLIWSLMLCGGGAFLAATTYLTSIACSNWLSTQVKDSNVHSWRC